MRADALNRLSAFPMSFARLGGDEFAVLGAGASCEKPAEVILRPLEEEH